MDIDIASLQAVKAAVLSAVRSGDVEALKTNLDILPIALDCTEVSFVW